MTATGRPTVEGKAAGGTILSTSMDNEQSIVGIVVVHFGQAETTLACLRSVLSDGSRAPRKVVVVDNSANLDPSALPPEVIHLPCPDNPGFGSGAHRGITALPPDAAVYVILNHDVELASGFLDAAVDALAAPRVGAAAGPIYLDRQGGPLWYAGGGINYLTGTVWQSRSPRRAQCPRRVGFLPGTAFAVKPQAWHQVGGFDRRIFLYNEDVDLSRKLRRRGWQLAFVPDLSVVHHLGDATGSNHLSPIYLEHLSRNRFRPFRSAPYLLYLATVHSGWVAVRCWEPRADGRLNRRRAA